MNRPLRVIAGLVLLALAACGPGQITASPKPTGSASPVASPTPSPSPTPASFKALIVTADFAANTSRLLLYDSGSGQAQQLLSINPGVATRPRFVSASQVSYTLVGGGTSSLESLPLPAVGAPQTVVSVAGTIESYAWSPDGSTLAYLVHDVNSGQARLQLRVNGVDRPAIPLNSVPGRGVGLSDEVLVQFSRDGQYVAVVDTFVGGGGSSGAGPFQVRRADGTLVFTPPGEQVFATMAAWSAVGSQLYYRDSSGVRVWDAATQTLSTLAPGLNWFDPAPSPDGRSIAYTIRDAQNVPHVEVYDLQSGQVIQPLGLAPRANPVFVRSGLIWYVEWQTCANCFFGVEATGKLLSYDLTARAESSLPFAAVSEIDVLLG